MAKCGRRGMSVQKRADDLIKRFGDRAGQIACNRADDTQNADLRYHYELVMEELLRRQK